MKVSTHLILALILLLNGCAIQSALIDVEPERSLFVIETAKMKLTYRGDIHTDAYTFTQGMVLAMQKNPLNDFNATKENYVRINSLSAKTDSAEINLHETTKKEEVIGMVE